MPNLLLSRLGLPSAPMRLSAQRVEAGRGRLGSSRRKNILILTATITPNAGVPNLMRSNPAQRLKDYEFALRFYIDQVGSGIDSIVFAENSASDLSSLRSIAAASPHTESISFLSSYALDYPPEFDRGYGELMLLDRVMDALAFTEEADVVFWKVTGRYIVRNIAQVIHRASLDAELFLHCRNRPRELVDMYLMGWTRRGYEAYLRGKCDAVATSKEHIRAGIHPEELLRSALMPDLEAKSYRTPKSHVSLRMRPTPELQGVRAGDNKEYSVHNRWKYKLRKLAGDLVPFLWI